MSLRFSIVLLIAFTACSDVVRAQSRDSMAMSLDDFFGYVTSYHPVASVASISLERGDAELLSARGGFDPVARVEFDQKYFNDTRYYRNLDGGISIPTVGGLSFEAGYERVSGEYIAPETFTPDAGLAYAGAKLTLGRGLLIDERRAQLRMAEIYRESTLAEQRQILNELLYSAGKAYWDWVFAFRQLIVYENAYDAAMRRKDAVAGSVEAGERAAVDSLEVGIQVQNRDLARRNARLEYLNAKAQLTAFLWSPEGQPVDLRENVVPDVEENLATQEPSELYGEEDIDSMLNSHPEILQSQFEIEQLNVAQRLKSEQLKPVVDLKYNAISEPLNGNPFTTYSINNYKWGLSFRMPLLLRKERGDLKVAKLKVSESTFKLENKRALIQANAAQAIITRRETLGQIQLYTRTVSDYRNLLQAEATMFEAGESSLFLVNAREIGYINSQVQLIKLEKQLQLANLQVLFTLGRLN